ncbi:MAG: RNA-binding protein, partial [Planctomycetota bacterium]
ALFARLPAERTGLDFVHHFTPGEQHTHLLGHSVVGGGLALGDTDGDGLPELLFTRPHGGSRLYQNLGGLRFDDITQAAGLVADAWGGGASFGDLDGDGDLDLYVCGYDTPNRLYWNQGDGRFEEGAAAAGLAFHGASIMLALADYDLDGDLDGFLLTNSFVPPQQQPESLPVVDGRVRVPEQRRELADVLTRPDGSTTLITAGQYDHLYRNEGEGRFSDVSSQAGISGNHFGLSATWWDPDVDGWPDLYVSNDFFGPDKLYQNQGDGSFVDVAPTALPHTPWFSMGSDAGDVDGDGLMDLLASDMAGSTHARRMATMVDLPETRWFLEASLPRQMVRNALYINTGTERFAEAAMTAGLAHSDWTWSTLFGDLDNDGLLDLFVSNGMSRDFFSYDMQAGAAGHERIMRDYWVHQPKLAEANLAFRNQGALSFASVGPEWGLDHVAASFGAALCDLDRDGDLDLVCNDFDAPVALFENRSVGGHVLAIELAGRGANTAGIGARVTLTTRGPDGAPRSQVRELYPSHGFMAGHEPRLHFGLGDHEQVEALEVSWPGGSTQRVTGLSVDKAWRIRQPADQRGADGEGDAGDAGDAGGAGGAGGEAPAALFRPMQGPVAAEMPYDDFARQPLLPARLSQLGPALAVGDVDGDGDDDVLLGGPAGQAAQLLRTGGGNLALETPEALSYDDYQEDMGALLFDLDSDGDLDLYVASGGVECKPGSSMLRDRLYLNDGAGQFSRAPAGSLPDARQSSSSIAAADIDGDGDLDLFVGSRSVPGRWPEGGHPRLLRNDGGTLVDAADELAPGLSSHGRVTGAAFSDVDDDGDPDLLVAHEWGPIRLWRNQGGRLSDAGASSGLARHTGWWNSVALGDPDLDGDLDGVAGNLGWGARTRPVPGQPAVLFHGDLDGSGVEVIAETAWVDDTLYPLRPRTDFLAALPFLADQFPTHAHWAHATLRDVFAPEALAAAGRLEASTPDSSLLSNDGSGRFALSPLPVMAQLAPVFGAAFLELDGDGLPDLVLAQNSYAPHPEQGRLDGGLSLALRGDGAGGFTALRADASGVVVPGDAKALAVTDLDGDGWPDLALSQNDGPLKLLLRRGGREAHMLAVRLQGPPGNPTGVGARLTLEQEGRRSQTQELSAGAGYLSQSAPVAWFGLAGAGQQPAAARLLVRWPDGARSAHEVPPGTTTLSVKPD